MGALVSPRVSPARFLRVVTGALALGATMNPRLRQGLGMAAAMSPLAALWPPGPERKAFLKRHLESFNTNPALAGPLIGALAGLEERAAGGDEEALRWVGRLRNGLEAPLAAAGDSWFWNGIRPGAVWWGGALALFLGGLGPLVFLVLYNAAHLGVRVGGAFWGFRRREGVASILRARWLRDGARVFPWMIGSGVLAVGVCVFSRAGIPLFPGVLGLLAGLFLGQRGIARGTLLGLGGIIFGLILAFTLSSN